MAETVETAETAVAPGKKYELDVEYGGKIVTIESDTPNPDPRVLRRQLDKLMPQWLESRQQRGPSGPVDPPETDFMEHPLDYLTEKLGIDEPQPSAPGPEGGIPRVQEPGLLEQWQNRKRHPEVPAGEAQQRQAMRELGQYPDDDFMYESPQPTDSGLRLQPTSNPPVQVPIPTIQEDLQRRRQERDMLVDSEGSSLEPVPRGQDTPPAGTTPPAGPQQPGLLEQIGGWGKALVDEFTPGAKAPQGPPMPGILDPELGDVGEAPPHTPQTPQIDWAEVMKPSRRPEQTVKAGSVLERMTDATPEERTQLKGIDKAYPELGVSALVAMRESSLQPWKHHNDGGEWAYGLYQFRGGRMTQFVTQLASYKGGMKFHNALKDKTVGTRAFNETFERLARQDPQAFGRLMKQFAHQEFFDPAFRYAAQQWGVKEQDIPAPIKEVLASASIHHGRWRQVIRDMGKHLKDVKNASWEERLDAFYKARRAYVKKIDFKEGELPGILRRYDFEERYARGGLRQWREGGLGPAVPSPANAALAAAAPGTPPDRTQSQEPVQAITAEDRKRIETMVEIIRNPDLTMEEKQWYLKDIQGLTPEQQRWKTAFEYFKKIPGVYLADKITGGMTSRMAQGIFRTGVNTASSLLKTPEYINANQRTRENNLVNIAVRLSMGTLGSAAEMAEPWADRASAQMEEIAEGLRTERPPALFPDKFGEAFGSFLMFMVPGLTTQAALARMSWMAPRLATLAGVTVNTATESMTEALDVYKSLSGIVGEEEAARRANKVLGLNMGFNFLFNYVGMDPVRRGMGPLLKATALNAVIGEGGEELVQYEVSRRAFWVPKDHPQAQQFKQFGWKEDKDRVYLPFEIKSAAEAWLIGSILGFGGKMYQQGLMPEGVELPYGKPISEVIKEWWDPDRLLSPATASAATVTGGTTVPPTGTPPAGTVGTAPATGAPAPAAGTTPPAGTPSAPPTPSPAGTAFTTSLGSTYTVSGTTTTRTKAPHPGHDPADVGLKPASELTLYGPGPDLTMLSIGGVTVPPGGRFVYEIEPQSDGTFTAKMHYYNPVLKAWGRPKEAKGLTINPQVGLHPLELWGKGEEGGRTVYTGSHVGNDITSVTYAPPAAPAAAPPAAAPSETTPAATTVPIETGVTPDTEPPEAVEGADTETTSTAPTTVPSETLTPVGPGSETTDPELALENMPVTWEEKDGTVREGTLGSDVSGRMVRVNLPEGGWTSVRRDQLSTKSGMPLPESQPMPIQGPGLPTQQEQLDLMERQRQAEAAEAAARTAAGGSAAPTTTSAAPEITAPETARPTLTPEQMQTIADRSFDGHTAGWIADRMDLDIEQVWEARDALGIPKNKKSPEYGKWKRDYQNEKRAKTEPAAPALTKDPSTPAVVGGEVKVGPKDTTSAGPPPDTTTIPAPAATGESLPVRWESTDGTHEGTLVGDDGKPFVKVTLPDGTWRTVNRNKLTQTNGKPLPEAKAQTTAAAPAPTGDPIYDALEIEVRALEQDPASATQEQIDTLYSRVSRATRNYLDTDIEQARRIADLGDRLAAVNTAMLRARDEGRRKGQEAREQQGIPTYRIGQHVRVGGEEAMVAEIDPDDGTLTINYRHLTPKVNRSLLANSPGYTEFLDQDGEPAARGVHPLDVQPVEPSEQTAIVDGAATSPEAERIRVAKNRIQRALMTKHALIDEEGDIHFSSPSQRERDEFIEAAKILGGHEVSKRSRVKLNKKVTTVYSAVVQGVNMDAEAAATTATVVDDTATSPEAEAAADQAVEELSETVSTPQTLTLNGQIFEVQPDGTVILERNIDESETLEALRQQGMVKIVGQRAKSPEDLAVVAQMLRDPRFETVYVIFVDKRGKILAIEALASGLPGAVSFDGNIAFPYMQDRMASLKASGYWMMHNHPSGDPTPSQDDYNSAEQIAAAVPGMKGEIVIDTGKYGFIKAPGSNEISGVYDLPPGVESPDLVRPSALVPDATAEMQAGYMGRMARQLQVDGFGVLFYLEPKTVREGNWDVVRTRVRGVQLVPMPVLEDGRAFATILLEGAKSFGGGATILHTFGADPELRQLIDMYLLPSGDGRNHTLHGHIDHQGDRFASRSGDQYEIYDPKWHGMPNPGDLLIINGGTHGVIDATTVNYDPETGTINFTSDQFPVVMNIHPEFVVGISRFKEVQDGTDLLGSGPLRDGEPPSGESGGEAAAAGHGGATGGADADVRPPVGEMGDETVPGGVRPGADAEDAEASGRDGDGLDAGATTGVSPEGTGGRRRRGRPRRGSAKPGGTGADVAGGRGGGDSGGTTREPDAERRDVPVESQPGSGSGVERPAGTRADGELTGEEAGRRLLGMTEEELAAFMAGEDEPAAPTPKAPPVPKKQAKHRKQGATKKEGKSKKTKQPPRAKTPLTPEQRKERYRKELEKKGLGQHADDLSELRDLFGEGDITKSAPPVPRHLMNSHNGYVMGAVKEARELNIIFRAEATPGPEGLRPGVDPKLYQRALPAMARLFKRMTEGGGSLAEFRDTLKEQMGPAAAPYLTQFILDHRAGKIDIEALASPVKPPEDPPVKHLPVAIELADSTDEIYGNGMYTPYQDRLVSTGAKAHPGKLVETASLASVQAPPLTYQPDLPASIIAAGAVSQPQIDEVAAAGQAHQYWLPADKQGVVRRQGRLLGDGPGTGKTHTLLGILLDNQRQGRKKAIVVSMKNDLFADMRDIWRSHFGGKPREEFRLIGNVKLDAPIDPNFEGTILATYKSLQKRGRIKQLLDWAGPEYEGVLLFDESHAAAKNFGSRPSKSAQVLKAIDRALPKARVVYASATSATQVKELGYAERLGLWGEGTDFADAREFARKMRNAGLATLEQIARDMKALGVLGARSLDWSDVEVRRLRHPTQPDQQAAYDGSAALWQQIHKQLRLKVLNMERLYGVKASKALTKGLWQRHHGTVQNFYQQVLAGLQMPTVIESIKADLAAGRSPVVQLAQTYETQQDRQLENLPADQVQTHRFTAANMIENYLLEHWPVYVVETYVDDNEQPQVRVKENPDGTLMIDEFALIERDGLIVQARALNALLPTNPLDQLLDAFGESLVAEVTGRTARLMTDPTTGKRSVQKRRKSDINSDSAAFRGGDKPILVYTSAKAGTGFSFHSGLNFGNQRQRGHYILETGWDPMTFYQSLNRTHRSNQAQPPVIYLVDTDVPGHQRVISTMAKGLQNLGALTQGERGALAQGSVSAQGLFSHRDNLETEEAEEALAVLYADILNADLMGMDAITFEQLSGFNLEEEKPGVPQFLNRLMAMPIDMQRLLFAAFNTRLDTVISDAIQEGTLDVGMQRLSADTTEILEEHNLSTYDTTGATTDYIKLRRFNKVFPMPYEDLLNRLDVLQMEGSAEGDGEYMGLYRAPRGKLYAVSSDHPRTDIHRGIRTPMVRLIAADGDETRVTLDRFNELYSPVEEDERTAWEQAIAELPPHKKTMTHLITGLLLPYWKLMGQDNATGRHRVVKVTASQAGRQRQLLGRVIPQMHIAGLLTRFGTLRDASLKMSQADFSPSEVYENLSSTDGATMMLDDGTFFHATLDEAGRPVIEVSNIPPSKVHRIAQMGVQFTVSPVQAVGRLPEGMKAVNIISAIMEGRTIQATVDFRSSESPWIDFAAPPSSPATPAAGAHPTNKAGFRKDRTSKEIAASFDTWFEEGFVPATPPVPGAMPTAAYHSSNPYIEDFLTRNKHRTEPRLIDRLITAYQKRKNQVAREFEHLPNTDYFMRARHELLRLNAQISVSIENAMIKIGNMFRSLTPEEYDIVSRLIVMEDALENMDFEDAERAEKSLPPRTPTGLGWSRENIEAEIVSLKRVVGASAPMQTAVDTRQKMWEELKKNYIEAYLSLGMDLSEKFTRDAYFRHWVQDMAQGMSANKSVLDGKLEAARSPSYLRRRGEQFKTEMTPSGLVVTPTYDYTTDLVSAELEVITKILYHTQVAATIKAIQEYYDFRPSFEWEAAQRNDVHVREHFRKLADAFNATKSPLAAPKDTDAMMRLILGKDLAIAFQRLFALAQAGVLPSLPHYDDLIDAMADVYLTRAHAMTEDEKNARLPGEYLPQLFSYMNWIMALPPTTGDVQESQSAVGQWFAARDKREKRIKQAILEESGREPLTWKDIQEEHEATHVPWQAVKGAVFYVGYTVPDQISQQLLDGHVARLGISKDMLHRAMIRGQQRHEMVLPVEVAATLNRFSERFEDGFWAAPINQWTKGYKWWTLNNPKRFLEVQMRNASGDVEVVLAANPAIMKKTRQAVHDLYHAFVLEEGMKGDLLFWHQQGGMVNTFNKTELADTDYLYQAMSLVGQGPGAKLNAIARWQRVMKNFTTPETYTTFSGALKAARNLKESMNELSDFREGILRYAAYLHSLEDIRSHGGKPTFYGASIRQEIDGLDGDPQAQAWHIANSLLGAYDRVGVAGQDARKFVLWFWSFQELNLRRYTRLFINATADDALAGTIGRKLLAKAANPMAYVRVGKVALGVLGLMGATSAWNYLFFHDEEEELPSWVRERPHLIFGRNRDGTVRVVTRLGSFADYLSWFGMDTPITTIKRLMNPHESIMEIILDAAKSPVKNMIGAVNPTIKMPFEILTGQKLYPDPFEPRSIPSRFRYFLEGFGAEDLYSIGKYASGAPQPGASIERSLFDMIGNSYEPKMGVIGEARDLERKFLKSIGQAPPMLVYTPKNNALWASKKSLRMGDRESAHYWLREYFRLGGSAQGLKRSMQAGAPMGSMSKTERARFMAWLTPEERRLVMRAVRAYHETLAPSTTERK